MIHLSILERNKIICNSAVPYKAEAESENAI